MNLSSGIAPIRKYLDLDLKIGLGSDVAGGQSESIFRAITDSIQVSKMYWRHVNQTCKPIVLDDSCLEHPQQLNVLQRLERAIYLSLDVQVLLDEFRRFFSEF